MRLDVVLKGTRTVLVPYKKEHVPHYHQWMQDPELQEATASEPLTLQEEFEMQNSWANDSEKCTFIILDKDYPDTPGTGEHGGAMAGDANLFWNDHDDHTVAEIMVMVAEARSRRKGVAEEALCMLMAYAVHKLGVTRFRAKISETNSPSLALFTKLGYTETARSAVFQEVTLELGVGDAAWHSVLNAEALLCMEPYHCSNGNVGQGCGGGCQQQL